MEMNYNILPSENYLPFNRDEAATTEARKKDLIDDVLGDRIEVLIKIMSDISGDINNRNELSCRLIKTIESGICDLKSKLYEIEIWQIGSNRVIDTRRNEIEKKIQQLEKEERDRETERWRDIAPLKKEFREEFKKYRDVLRRYSIISDERIDEN